MGWTRLRQQQQRGAQLPKKEGEPLASGGAPAEAVAGREVQDHDYADLQVSDGEPQRDIDYPATNPPERLGDVTPSAPDLPQVQWDDIAQPERHSRQPGTSDDLPLPEGK